MNLARLPRVQLGHELHPRALAVNAPTPHMGADHVENLAVPPPRRHGAVRGLEVANRLRPLARGRVARDLVAGGLGVGRVGRVRRRQLLLLRGPVVDVPVVLVEQQVVLVEQRRGERRQVLGGEGGEEEVGFERSALAGLV